MNRVLIYTSAICPYCVAAKNFLVGRGLGYEEIRIDMDAAQRDQMIRLTNRRSVPQIFINDHHVGGYDDMVALDRAGGFNTLLNKD